MFLSTTENTFACENGAQITFQNNEVYMPRATINVQKMSLNIYQVVQEYHQFESTG